MLSSDNVYILINYTSFMESLFVTISVAGLLYLRWKEPNRERPIKVHLFYPIVFLVLCGFLVLLPVYVSPVLVGVDIMILIVGSFFYLIFIKWKSKPRWFVRFFSKTEYEIHYHWPGQPPLRDFFYHFRVIRSRYSKTLLGRLGGAWRVIEANSNINNVNICIMKELKHIWETNLTIYWEARVALDRICKFDAVSSFPHFWMSARPLLDDLPLQIELWSCQSLKENSK